MNKLILRTLKTALLGLFFLCCAPKRLYFPDAIKQCGEKKTLKQGITVPAVSCATGSLFPHINCTSITGQSIDQSYFKGKISIINLWFIGCAPCVTEIPGFNQIVRKYGKDRIRYLAIGRESKEEIEEFLNKNPWDFDHVFNGQGIIEGQIQLPWGFPTTFVVDEKGVIAKAFHGGFSDSRAIEKIQLEICPVIDSLLEKKKQ
jgi:thiol-disulfide isomerase/thioredoxin